MVEWDIYVEVVSIPGATGAQESDCDLDKQQPGGSRVLLHAVYTSVRNTALCFLQARNKCNPAPQNRPVWKPAQRAESIAQCAEFLMGAQFCKRTGVL